MEGASLAHLAAEEDGRIVGACLAAENDVRKGLAGLMYVHAENAPALRRLLARAMSACRKRGMHTFLVDLVNEHRHFEPTYRDLGFQRAAEFAVYGKTLD